VITILAHGDHETAGTLLATMPLVAGLIAGAAHFVTGPDHMAAVAPLAVERRRAWVAGCVWGLGHSGSVWVLAALALLLREALPIDAISSVAERLVGVVLIAIGLWGLRRVLRLRVHTHTHTHAGPDGAVRTHTHTHVHAARPGEPHEHRREPHAHTHGLLGVGALHGLAGTSHVLGVLPALGMPTRAGAVAYTIAFGVGSIVGMGLFTGAIGALVRAASAAGRNITRGMLSVSSLAAIGVGAWWLVLTNSG